MKHRIGSFGFLLCLLSVVALASPVLAGVVFVDVDSPYSENGNGSAAAPYRTLADAAVNSQEGDTILLEAGTYTVSAPIPVAHSLAIIGRGADRTIVDVPTQMDSVFVRATADTRLRFFVLDGIGFVGHALSTGVVSVPLPYFMVDNAVLRNCTFSGMYELFTTLAVAGLEPPSSVVVVGNTSTDSLNTCQSMGYYVGVSSQMDDVTILNNRFSDTCSPVSSAGPAPHGVTGLMKDNVFKNLCEPVWLSGAWTIVNNVIENVARRAALAVVPDDRPFLIANNTIGFTNGVAIELHNDVPDYPVLADIFNNIFINNQGVIDCSNAANYGNYTASAIANNLSFGNGADIECESASLTGNLTADPKLQPDGIHLSCDSGAIDKGLDLPDVPKDIDQDTRISTDIGADEFVGKGMLVQSMELRFVKGPGMKFINQVAVDVTVRDSEGQPVSGAVVTGSLAGPDSGLPKQLSGTTDATGKAILTYTSPNSKLPRGQYNFCVQGVSNCGFTYESSANVVTCQVANY